jgi:hypothetical protein
VEAETRSGRSGSTWDFHGISMGFLVGFWWLMVSELCFIDPIFLGDRKLRYIEKKYDLPCLGRQVVSCSFFFLMDI